MRWLIGCVADRNPKYLDQALRLVQSIRWFGGTASEADLMVCCVGGVPESYCGALASYGARVVPVEPYSALHPHSNKLRLLQLEGGSTYDQVTLLDCDTIVVQDPAPFLCDAFFAAKPADVATVTSEIFQRLFHAFQVALPEATLRCTVSQEATIPYFNAGVLSFSREALSSLVPVWLGIHDRLLTQLELLEDRQTFCEQASLAIAVAAANAPTSILDNALNFPLHFAEDPKAPSNFDLDPVIIHYHSLADPSGQIKESGLPKIDSRIRAFNQRLRKERETNFSNALFWDSRYTLDPGLGSGLGSRGEHRGYKRRILARIVERHRPETVLDVGCGDIEVGSVLPAKGYTGIDISEQVIRSNKERYRDRNFVSGDFLALDLPAADMVVCLDVLIHLSDRNVYRNFVRRLVELCKRVGVVAGDDTDQQPGPTVFFHEPLDETLREFGATGLRKIGSYRHVSIYQFFGPNAESSGDGTADSRSVFRSLRNLLRKNSG